MPRLFGLNGKPKVEGGKLAPLEAYGVKIMSMGFLVDENVPMVWRGPMVSQAISQMLGEVAWGELDALVIDMPPGTGDVQLTMAQQVPLAGAVDRLDPAGSGADRRAPRRGDVPESRGADPRRRSKI